MMKEVSLIIVVVMTISLSASAMVFPSAKGSGHRVDIILAQSTEQETNQEIEQEAPSGPGTPQEEMGSGQGTVQDTESTQGLCTDPADCPEQNEITSPETN